MALFIPTLGSCNRRMTAGERRVGERLKRCLDEDTTIWYEPPIARHCLTPDFVLLHPARGLLVLEVKDWRLDNIDFIDPQRARLKEPAVEVKNPLRQARNYSEEIAKLLQLDPLLVNSDGNGHVGKLLFPFGYGVVLANITRSQFKRAGLGASILL